MDGNIRCPNPQLESIDLGKTLGAGGVRAAGVDPLIDIFIHIYRHRSRSSRVVSKMLLNMANARRG